MVDIDQIAYESYQTYCLRLGFPPAPFDTWYRNRFGKAKPMHGNAAELDRRKGRVQNRRRVAPLPVQEPVKPEICRADIIVDRLLQEDDH